MPFVDAMRSRGNSPAVTNLVPYGGGATQLTAAPGVHQQCRNPDFSNIYKVHNNWNVCFRCRFDIEDGHTPITCPSKSGITRICSHAKNARHFIVVGYNPCTKGIHKTVLPSRRNAWQFGAESYGLANKCNSLVSAYETSLYPTPNTSLSANDDNDVTVVTSIGSHNWTAFNG
jgi:hypothetical protein